FERVNLAPFVKRAELSVVHRHVAVVFDANLPMSGPGQAPEAAPVDDVPLVYTGRSGAFDLLGARSIRLHQPVNVLRAVALGIVDVELAAEIALGFFPVNLLASRLEDMKIQVDVVGIPDQGELRVADLDRDAADQLAPIAEARQAESIAVAGARVI